MFFSFAEREGTPKGKRSRPPDFQYVFQFYPPAFYAFHFTSTVSLSLAFRLHFVSCSAAFSTLVVLMMAKHHFWSGSHKTFISECYYFSSAEHMIDYSFSKLYSISSEPDNWSSLSKFIPCIFILSHQHERHPLLIISHIIPYAVLVCDFRLYYCSYLSDFVFWCNWNGEKKFLVYLCAATLN